MSLVPLVGGSGLWMPPMPGGILRPTVIVATDVTLDADEEELQILGRVYLDGGGTKTFGTAGSKIDWLPGAAITFAANATLRVGVKKASRMDLAAGPPARATLGAGAFDVYDDLVGGSDTIASTTWRSETMTAGTPFTVTQGDYLAVCFHLETTAGTPSVKVRNATPTTAVNVASMTLITSGSTYTQQNLMSNLLLTFDDGTLGWIPPTYPFNVADAPSATIGAGNVYGNIVRMPFPCQIDALVALPTPANNGAAFALELYSAPLGTPVLIESVPHDVHVMGSLFARLTVLPLTTPRTLASNTDYAIGVKQLNATAVTMSQHEVFAAAHFKPHGMGPECYAAISTGGATFVADTSGLRRYRISMQLSALDNGVSAGSGAGNPIGLVGGL